MKELSIEEKAKRYDEALEKARKLYEQGTITESLCYVFPELKEFEDGRIRNELIGFIKKRDRSGCDYDYDKWIAWFEKQGKKESQVKCPTFTFDDILALQCCMETVKKVQKDKDLYEKLNDLHGRVYDAYHLEKQGEQNPINVVPKFQNGQWIVWQNKCYKVNYNGCGYELIDQNGLSTSLEYGTIEENAHLWTIEDAKDGDVLCNGTAIFIFKDLLSDGSVMSYCDYDTNSGESNAFCPLSMNLMCSKITPATKEQRDTLMKAIADAGYTFDFEKKELTKIEDEPENYKQYLMNEITGLVTDYIRQKPDWSEEEERNIACYNPYKEVVESIAEMCKHYDKASHSSLRDFYDNVKVKCKDAKEYDSLFPQNAWKPSDKQMKALNSINVIGSISYPGQRQELIKLFNDLKKLREKQ